MEEGVLRLIHLTPLEKVRTVMEQLDANVRNAIYFKTHTINNINNDDENGNYHNNSLFPLLLLVFYSLMEHSKALEQFMSSFAICCYIWQFSPCPPATLIVSVSNFHFHVFLGLLQYFI